METRILEQQTNKQNRWWQNLQNEVAMRSSPLFKIRNSEKRMVLRYFGWDNPKINRMFGVLFRFISLIHWIVGIFGVAIVRLAIVGYVDGIYPFIWWAFGYFEPTFIFTCKYPVAHNFFSSFLCILWKFYWFLTVFSWLKMMILSFTLNLQLFDSILFNTLLLKFILCDWIFFINI